MECGCLTALFDLLAIDVEDRIGNAGRFDLIEGEVERWLVSAGGKKGGRDLLGAGEKSQERGVDADRGARGRYVLRALLDHERAQGCVELGKGSRSGSEDLGDFLGGSLRRRMRVEGELGQHGRDLGAEAQIGRA